MSIEVIDSIDAFGILQEYKNLESQFEWLEDDKTKQCSLQHLENRPSFIEGCGRARTSESNFKICHSIFLNTVFEQLMYKYGLYRTRFMWVKPKRCYSLHRDFGYRIHIPLVTNPSAMFVFRDTGLHHLPVGKVYKVDTTKIHSFANFGDKDRLHIIGCI